MTFQRTAVEQLFRAQVITDVDVVLLQDALTWEGPLSEPEASELFALDAHIAKKHHSWRGFFIDALVSHTLSRDPQGYLTAHKVDWVLAQASPAGRILTAEGLELVTSLLSRARWTPHRLISALFDEVYCAVAAGDGVLRTPGEVEPGTITQRDCDLIRHILYAAGNGRQQPISRIEAQALIAINSAIRMDMPPLQWMSLFSQAIGDAILGSRDQAGPVRERYLQPMPSIQSQAALVDQLRRQFESYQPLTAQDKALRSLECQRIALVTGDEDEPCNAAWLSQALATATPCATIDLLREALEAPRDHQAAAPRTKSLIQQSPPKTRFVRAA